MNYQFNGIKNFSNRESPDSPLNMYVGPYSPYNQRQVSRYNNNYGNNYNNQYSNYQNQNNRNYYNNNNPYMRSFYTPQPQVKNYSSDYGRENQNNENNFLNQNLQRDSIQNLTLYNYPNSNNGNAFINSSYNIIKNSSSNPNINSYQRNQNYYPNQQNNQNIYSNNNNNLNLNYTIPRQINYNPLNNTGKNIIQSNPYSYNQNYNSPYNQNTRNYNTQIQYNQNKSNPKEIISLDSLPEYNETNCSAVKEYSYKEDPNRTFRDYMEDKGKAIDCFNNNPNNALFCLFDGHGGNEVSTYLQNHFSSFFKEIINNITETSMKNLFNQIDEKLKQNNYYNVGSTANIIYITNENNKKILYSANVGDTRSILISNNQVRRLSYDHRASDPQEYSRIINGGGIVFRGRVYGVLMLSRAFADWELKNFGVSCIPHFCKVELNEFDKYVVIASDGVWDVFNDNDILRMSFNVASAKEFCGKIIQESLRKGSTDNLSCFVIKI